MNESRKQFQKWWGEWFGEAPLTPWDELWCGDGYSAEDIDHMWDAWKAASEAQPTNKAEPDDNFYSWFGREWHENYQHNQYTAAAKQMLGVMAESAWVAATEAQKLKQTFSIPDVKVYEEVPYGVGLFKTHRDCYCDGWNACLLEIVTSNK